jgi:hypothetical protein
MNGRWSKQVEDDTSIFLVRQALVHLTNTPSLLFLNLALSYSWLCIKLIDVI